MSSDTPSAASAEQVTLSGWFHVLWGDPPRGGGGPKMGGVLVDDDGKATTLLVDEQVTKPLGGPRALDRRRVRIIGERVQAPAGAVRVLSIDVETGAQ